MYVFQLRDFLLVYNRMTEICFQRCSSNFNYRNLTMDEVGKAKITVTVSATWWYCLIAVFCVSTRFLSSVFSVGCSIWGSPQRIVCLHLTLPLASSSVTSTFPLLHYIHEFSLWSMDFPLFFLPTVSTVNKLCPIYHLSLLCTSKPSLPYLSNFVSKLPNLSSLIYSSLNLSILVMLLYCIYKHI